MTKDEARVYLYSAIEEVALHLLSSNEAERAEAREFIDEHLDAFAQAHTDAALADTVGLLEWLMKYGDIYIEWAEPKTLLGHSLVVLRKDFEGNTGPFFYHKYFRKGEPIPERDPLSRADALALLAGKEKKG